MTPAVSTSLHAAVQHFKRECCTAASARANPEHAATRQRGPRSRAFGGDPRAGLTGTRRASGGHRNSDGRIAGRASGKVPGRVAVEFRLDAPQCVLDHRATHQRRGERVLGGEGFGGRGQRLEAVSIEIRRARQHHPGGPRGGRPVHEKPDRRNRMRLRLDTTRAATAASVSMSSKFADLTRRLTPGQPIP